MSCPGGESPEDGNYHRITQARLILRQDRPIIELSRYAWNLAYNDSSCDEFIFGMDLFSRIIHDFLRECEETTGGQELCAKSDGPERE